ncbi:MAG: monovalent cation/H+ antiporter subunit D family protein [Candidatus Omnitrophica bacterium]|nr:monovalent cation/H+ antiporter subunit D family protein [Candidatus Omnitrophota bacterium]
MILPLFVIVPLATAFLVALFADKIKHLGDVLTTLAAAFLLGLSLYAAIAVGHTGVLVAMMGGWPPPVGICLVGDGLSVFMLVIVNLIAFLAMLYSVNYMNLYTAKWKFHALFMLMLTGMAGVIVSGDLFNLYIFLEIASVAGYCLVAFGTDAQELEAAFRYAIMGAVASLFILLGVALLYSYTSTLNLADMALVLAQKEKGMVITFVSVLFLAGFGLKAALVPCHAWLPDAHSSAPAPISAMLSGVFIKTIGIYAMIRIFFNIFGITDAYLSVLMVLGVVSMLVAVVLALGQWDLKRLLAYHSISQIGYIVLGIGLGTPLGVLGGLFHLFNHSVFKSLLFLNSGAVDYSVGTRNLKEMSGLREKMPVTAGTSFVASMSISGIPPFNGFFSKLIIILACIQKGCIWYAFAAVIGSILTLVSFTKVQKYAFFGKLKEKYADIKEVPLFMKFSMVVLAVICVLAGLLLLPPFKFFLNDAARVLLAGKEYASAVLTATLK